MDLAPPPAWLPMNIYSLATDAQAPPPGGVLPQGTVVNAAAAGAYTRAGADFDIGTISYQYQWGR